MMRNIIHQCLLTRLEQQLVKHSKTFFQVKDSVTEDELLGGQRYISALDSTV